MAPLAFVSTLACSPLQEWDFGTGFSASLLPASPQAILLAAVWGVPGSLQGIHSSILQCPAGAAGPAHAPALQVGEGT